MKVAGSKIEALERYLAFRAREGETGLWVFNDVVAEELELDAGDETVRETTLKIVSDLLEAGLIRPGFPTRDGRFESWALSADEALRRIAREWDALGEREPSIGDIVWFEATEKGEEYVADYSPKDSGLAVEDAE